MTMKKRPDDGQGNLWIAHQKVAQAPGHPFYKRLNQILKKEGFDRYAESLCEPYYDSQRGRKSIAPGTYFRMLLIGYFEGIASERGIEWRAADSLSLRQFLGLGLEERVPDHSTLSRTRQRLPLEVQVGIFQWILKVLVKRKLLKGKSIGVDATTLEANAAMRSIVRRDTGEGYDEFLESLARESGIETPTREDLAKLDKKRPKKGSNDDWQSPDDPDSGITKMKDGRTHLAHKVEHSVDLESDAIIGVEVYPGHEGDTSTLPKTLQTTDNNLDAIGLEPVKEVVCDKGYHSGKVLETLATDGTRTYISEPDRGRRNWKKKAAEQKVVYDNRKRIRGARGKQLMKLRAEKVERGFAHTYPRESMRRTWLRGTENILKRLLIHAAGFNLGLIMRKEIGMGRPRGMQGRKAGFSATISSWIRQWTCSATKSWEITSHHSSCIGQVTLAA